ncbi:MAG: hypothetical protein RJB11_3176, partial [Planctomycetota bacterium]
KKATKNDSAGQNKLEDSEPAPPRAKAIKETLSNENPDKISPVASTPDAPASEHAAHSQPVEPPREKSMLQSSWDALASLFGVASEQPRQDTKPAENPTKSTKSESHLESPGSAKPKRTPTKSMWGRDEDATPAATQSPETSFEVSSTDTSRQPNPRREVPSFGHETQESVESDRRGPRRSPRRGRGDRQAENPEEQIQSQRQPREPRSNRDRTNVQPHQERTSDDSPASQRKSEDSRRENRRNENRRDDDRRERRPSKDRQESSSVTPKVASKKPSTSGFAAGLASENDLNEVDDQISFDSRGSGDPEVNEESQRNRRKKRRGRRRDDQPTSDRKSAEASGDSFESENDLDQNDRSSELSDARPRHGKIPSWTEIIGVVVQANVANHQKQSSGGRGRHRRPN